MEMVKYFNKKHDSSIIVYSLPISFEKKKMIIEKIKEIPKAMHIIYLAWH
jgi:hypothetical protein